MSNWRVAPSAAFRFASASCACRRTVVEPVPAGVPQSVRGALAHAGAVPAGKSPAAQPSASAPVASNLRPNASPGTA